MSGIVGSKLNHRGSGRVAKLGTDGQVLTSAGAGVSAVYEDAAGGGKCLQVVEYSTTGTISSNSTSWGQYGSIEQAITPTAASSKIKLTLSTGISGSENRGFIRLYYDVNGGGYSVCDPYGAASSSRTRCHLYVGNNSGQSPGSFVTILHTPSYTLTDVLTYQVWSYVDNSVYPLYFGRDLADSDAANNARTQTILRAEEIGA